MKTKFTLLILAVAVLTLSFTFSMKKSNEKSKTTVENNVANEPIGGLGSEDKL